MRHRAAQSLAVVVLMLMPLAACSSKDEQMGAATSSARTEPEIEPSSSATGASRWEADPESTARRFSPTRQSSSVPGEHPAGASPRVVAEAEPQDEPGARGEADGSTGDRRRPGKGLAAQGAPLERESRPEVQARLNPRDSEALGGLGAEPKPSTLRETASSDLREELPYDSPRASIDEAEPPDAEIGQPADVFPGDVDYLAQLESFDPVLRAEAAEMIEPEGLGLRALLVVAAEDPDPLVRVSAVSQLGDAESRAALRGLVQALSDVDRRVVLEAIDAIEFVAGPRVIPRLVPLLDHADGEVREAAAEAIDFLE